MELLLYEGLVSMLVRELNDYLTSDEEHHRKRREERIQGGKKRKLTDPTTPETLSKVKEYIEIIDYVIANSSFFAVL